MYIKGTAMKFITINIQIVQSRKKSIDNLTYQKGVNFFKACTGTSNWTRVDQNFECASMPF